MLDSPLSEVILSLKKEIKMENQPDVDKKFENRLRKLAHRRGYRIQKSRRQIDMDNFGEYMLVDIRFNATILGSRYDATLDDIEGFLKTRA
jgi:hypothetical protein